MATMRKTLTVTVLVLAPVLAARGDEKKEPQPANLPVTAKLVAKKTTYQLDLGGKTGDEFRKMLKDAEKSGRTPPAPAVDLVLELTNTSDKDVMVWIGGDPTQIILNLKGPSAVSVSPLRPFTTEFRAPRPVTLGPGKTTSLPIASLSYGFRGQASQAYWTEPGEYTLTASFTTGISPAPPGTKEEAGFGKVTLTAAPVQLKVEAK
jgi:hypothetical protein